MWHVLSQAGNCRVEPHKLKKLKAKLAKTELPCSYLCNAQEIPLYRRVRKRKNAEIQVMSIPRVWFADECSETNKPDVRYYKEDEEIPDPEDNDEVYNKVMNDELADDPGVQCNTKLDKTYLSNLLCRDCYVTLALSRCSVVQHNNISTQTKQIRNVKTTQASTKEDKATSRRLSSNYLNSPLFDFLNDHAYQTPKKPCHCYSSSPQLHYS